ncbi:hypothetical protein BH24ACI3_BH24ACI3_12150 [soil metagenome]
MAHVKNENIPVDVDLGYEQNDIQVKGIAYFAVGLLLLIVITFGLMIALYGVLEDEAKARLASDNLMTRSEMERLPPEPRLQGAPGFGVEGAKERMNLELTAPQSEYWELEKQWEMLWKEGRMHPETGTTISMPIEKAKEVYLQQEIKAKTGPEAEKTLKESRMFYSAGSAGRLAAETRR